MGRRVGLAVYLTILTYMVVVGFGTVIRGVYFPTFPADDGWLVGRTCDEGRSELARALRVQSASYVSTGDRAANERFLRTWDARFHVLRTRCDDASTAELDGLRHRVEIILRRFEHENASAFSSLGAPPTPLVPQEPPR